ncbi:MAG TPA: SemiSWEET family transporter [Beijerinckiaceae bacterium]|nr:SemiSWEET family transporter [Beijerinckiaceae bacterium]
MARLGGAIGEAWFSDEFPRGYFQVLEPIREQLKVLLQFDAHIPLDAPVTASNAQGSCVKMSRGRIFSLGRNQRKYLAKLLEPFQRRRRSKSAMIIIILGTSAALCSMASFVPQAWRIIRTRDTEGISPGTYFLTVLAFALWTAYGVLLDAWPLMVSNGFNLLLSAFILIMTILPQRIKNAVADRIDPNDDA